MGHSETLELRELAIPCCLTSRDLFVVLIFRAGTVPAPVLLDSRDAGTDRKPNLSVHNLALGYFVKPFDNKFRWVRPPNSLSPKCPLIPSSQECYSL